MTQTPPDAAGSGTQQGGPRVSGEQMRDLGRLRRSITDRKVAGVAGGLGRHLDIDPTLLRVAFVVLAFFGGAGLLLYGAAWLLVPEDGQEEGAIAASPSTRTTVLVVVGVVAALLVIGDGWGPWGWGWGFPWPLLVVGLVVALVLLSNRSGARPAAGPPAPAYGPETPPGGWTSASTTPTRPEAPEALWAEQPPGGATPTQAVPWQPPTPPPDRGPRLFWPTVALVALALGVLGLYDVAGGAVVDGAYPALALAVVGAMLTLGAWFGRTGGLIFLGVVAALALALSTVVPSFGVGEIDRTPTTAAQLDDDYSLAIGSIDLDLSRITDIDQLDGRSIDIDSTAGEVVVTVPDGVDVDVDATIDGAGEIEVFDRTINGPDLHVERTLDGGPGAPKLDLNIDLMAGRVEVRTA